MTSQEKPIDRLHPETQSETPSQLRRAKIRYLLISIGACWLPALVLLVIVSLMKAGEPVPAGSRWLIWAGIGTGLLTALGLGLVVSLDPRRRNTFVTVVYTVTALAGLAALFILLFASHWGFCDASGVCHTPYPRPM
jgi:thiol:disulfide interchange protein